MNHNRSMVIKRFTRDNVYSYGLEMDKGGIAVYTQSPASYANYLSKEYQKVSRHNAVGIVLGMADVQPRVIPAPDTLEELIECGLMASNESSVIEISGGFFIGTITVAECDGPGAKWWFENGLTIQPLSSQ